MKISPSLEMRCFFFCFFLLLFSRFRFAYLAETESQQADEFLKSNGLEYKPVCMQNILIQ